MSDSDTIPFGATKAVPVDKKEEGDKDALPGT